MSLSALTALAALLAYSCVKRLKADRARREHDLLGELEIANVDPMTWQQFESAASGQTASSDLLAYESDGLIRTYAFSYVVRAA